MPRQKAPETALNELHDLVATEFAKRIKDGSAAPADLSAAIRFLKDNGITATRTPNNPLGQLSALVPFPTEDDVEVE